MHKLHRCIEKKNWAYSGTDPGGGGGGGTCPPKQKLAKNECVLPPPPPRQEIPGSAPVTGHIK